jgi:hypothetical protein
MTLGPPLWATGSWATDAWANGTWAEDVVVVTAFGDLTTLWATYVDTLKDAHVAALDVTTLVANDVATMRTGNANLDDLNTAYASYLS